MRVFEQVSGEHPIGQCTCAKIHHGALKVFVCTSSDNSIQGVYIIRVVLCCFRTPFHSLDGCLEHAERVCARSQVTLLRSLPVDDVPNVLDVGSLTVLVLEIVRMLPLKLQLVTHDHCHEAKSDLPCRHQRWEPRPYQQQDLGPWSSR